ncbi:MAG TPA: flagellar hook-basal body complex protein [Stellaceae bacterium]|nr:flagellar hook-basal body complex protein [Stellaceae bacterium]
MSIFGALLTGVSGLTAESQALSMISDNIANSNTTAYKGTEASFSTLVTQSAQAGLNTAGGVVAYPSPTINQQGLLQAASSNTDLAISGGGFFVVSNSATGGNSAAFSFTRDGSFSVNANGDLVNGDGFFLQGQPLTSAEAAEVTAGDDNVLTSTSLDSLKTININGLSGSAVPTSTVTLAAELPSNATATSTPNTITVPIYDSQGGEHDLTLTLSVAPTQTFTIPAADTMANGDSFTLTLNGVANPITVGPVTGTPPTTTDVANAINTALTGQDITGVTASAVNGTTIQLTDSSGNNYLSATNALTNTTEGYAAIDGSAPASPAANTWNVTASIAGGTVAFNGTNQVSFNSNGTFATGFSGLTVDWDTTGPAVPTSPQALSFNLGTPGESNGLTQTGNQFSATEVNQNGLEFGTFTGITIDQNGIVTANFDNGLKQPIFIIPIATFNNPNGLAAESGNAYSQTNQSGSYLLEQAGTGAAGQIAPSELESSNVDIAQEFSNLIITQQAYAANSKVLSTADQMIQTLLQATQG